MFDPDAIKIVDQRAQLICLDDRNALTDQVSPGLPVRSQRLDIATGVDNADGANRR